MKPLIQKLHLGVNTSFIAKTFRTPNFEVGWHQHIEYELILFTEGSGLSFIGNHIGEFDTGDIYFLGSNLPHTFQKKEPTAIASAIVVQFKEDFWGENFLQLPECRSIRQLLAVSSHGLKLKGKLKKKLRTLLRDLEGANNFHRISLLGECLELIAGSNEYTQVSNQDIRLLNNKATTCIDKIFQFTIQSFREDICLSQVAAIACMSIPAFCNYFKRSTKKTYIDFLNEVRVGYACNLLLETKKSVLEICYESGYNTMSNFHKQFLRIKNITPLQFRKAFAPNSITKGTNREV